MKFSEYQILARETANYPFQSRDILGRSVQDKMKAVIYPCLGLAGETGELLDKLERDWLYREPKAWTRIEVKAELGDVLWYISQFVTEAGIDLTDLVEDLNIYQAGVASIQHGWSWPDVPYDTPGAAIRFSARVGEIVDRVKKCWRNNGFIDAQSQEILNSHLHDLTHDYANLVTALGFELDEIAEYNLAKLADRNKRGKLLSEGDNR